MKTYKLSDFPKKLHEEMEKTLSKIKDYEAMCRPVSPDSAIGRVSRMDAINNSSVVMAALNKAKEKLEKLKSIETFVNTKDFGSCIKCKKEIPLERLFIVPESSFCVKCA